MEVIIGFLVAVVVATLGLLLRRALRSAAGYGKRPGLLSEGETPSHELELHASKIAFGGFSPHSAHEGRLFLTKRRLLFTNSRGTRIGLEVPLDRLGDFSLREAGFLRRTELVVKYKGRQREQQRGRISNSGSWHRSTHVRG